MTTRLPTCAIIVLALAGSGIAQGPGRGGAQPPQTAKAAAPIDITGYWVSIIVDEWRFRVTPQKGDIAYMPLNPEARRIAMAWDPAKDEAEGKACKAYGAIGLMQRPGRLHITWADDNTLRIDADAGNQTRTLHFAAQPESKTEPSWQGYSLAQWQRPGAGRRAAAPLETEAIEGPSGTLRVVTTSMLPGYLRKNGVPYSDRAVLTEYINKIEGADGQPYLLVTAEVEDPVYLVQPFVRTYQFKKVPDNKGWDPTPCWTR